jgi:TctA family transporter
MAAEAQRSRAGRAIAVASIAGAVIGAIIAALALALLSPRFRPVPTPVAHTRPGDSR